MKIQKLHGWDLTPKEAVDLQRELLPRLTICPLKSQVETVAGTDISYSKGDDRLFAAVVVLDIATLKVIEVASHVERALFPYVPGLLAFREIPPLLSAFEKLQVFPDVIICDGQGIAHPRGMGLAAHLGLWLEIPTIGCAKTRLVGDYSDLSIEKGAQTPLMYKERVVGSVLRSKKGVRPLFISPGHLIDVKSSVDVVYRCVGSYRLPESTRQAHLMVNHLRHTL